MGILFKFSSGYLIKITLMSKALSDILSPRDNTPETGEMADEERCGQKDNLIEQKDTGFQGKNDNIELVEKVALHKSMTVKIEDKSSPLELQYGLRSYPPVLITLMAALQVSRIY